MRVSLTICLLALLPQSVPVAVAQGVPAQEISAAASMALEQVAGVHGAAGVFAVAGYRMGERALKELGEARGSFALDVTHRTPLQVQYSCIADGWQAATGVSAGKLNLHIVEAGAAQLETVITDKRTGQELVFRLKPEFLRQYLNLPMNQAAAKGREVAMLPEEQIFTVQARGKRSEAEMPGRTKHAQK